MYRVVFYAGPPMPGGENNQPTNPFKGARLRTICRYGTISRPRREQTAHGLEAPFASPPQGSTAWLQPPARRPFLRHQIPLFSARRADAAASSSTARLGSVDRCHPPRPAGGASPCGVRSTGPAARAPDGCGRLRQSDRRLVAARPLIRVAGSPPLPYMSNSVFREVV